MKILVMLDEDEHAKGRRLMIRVKDRWYVKYQDMNQLVGRN